MSPTGQRLGLAGREELDRFDAPFARRDRQSAGKILRSSLSVALNSSLRLFQKVCRSRMTIVPIRYVEPVYRPPSEADSLILPVTDGCSWNRCTFCEMYTAPQKRFRPRSEEEVLESIRRCHEQFGDGVERVFLADGDAMTLSTRRLVTVLEAIRRDLPGVRRVSSYCLPRNLRKKSAAELRELAELGLSLVYVGAESGDDEVLSRVNKGETFATTREALEKLQEAGIKRSVMILNGLGGQALSQQHALNSAALMNVAQPEYLATLVVSFPKGEARLRGNFPSWEPLSVLGLMQEMELFLSELELKRTIFRTDHASNWLILKGTLGEDKLRLLQELRAAIAAPEAAPLRPAWARGL
jgi:radical SAM superfamily enzyme YgiQ (UPF0313 family)